MFESFNIGFQLLITVSGLAKVAIYTIRRGGLMRRTKL
jgi:hypothetical protein